MNHACPGLMWAGRPRASLTLLTLLLTTAVLCSVTAAPAHAHDELVSTDPADGSTLDTAPAQVRLSFAEPPLALGLQVVVTGPSGAVQSGPPQLRGSTVLQPLRPGAPAGTYGVLWKVTSDDGHPVSGQLRFSVRDGSTSPPPTSAVASTAGVAPTTAVAAARASSTGDLRPVALGVLVALVAVAAAGLMARRRRRVLGRGQ